MNVSALIVEDEPVARAALREMLADVSWIAVVGEAASGPAAVQAINALRPELVLLDVQLPGLLGTDVLLHVEYQPFVVFTTAFSEHAVTAFELGAVDYILKPFGAERLTAALERVKAAIGEPTVPGALPRFHEAMASGPISRLFVRTGDTLVPVAVADVARFEADGDYVAVCVGRARHLVHLSLNRLAARLDPRRFVRVHRTHIVNLDHVTAFRRTGDGRFVAELRDGTRVPVSRARAQELRTLGA